MDEKQISQELVEKLVEIDEIRFVKYHRRGWIVSRMSMKYLQKYFPKSSAIFSTPEEAAQEWLKMTLRGY